MTLEQEAKAKKIVIIVAVIIFAGMGIFVGIRLKQTHNLKEDLNRMASVKETVLEEPIDEIKEIQEPIQETVNLNQKNERNNSQNEVVVVNLYPNMKKSSAKAYRASMNREKKMYKAGLSSKEYDIKFEDTKESNTYNIVAKKDNEFITHGEAIEFTRTKNPAVLLKSVDLINMLFTALLSI